jgi:hypothetical protein
MEKAASMRGILFVVPTYGRAVVWGFEKVFDFKTILLRVLMLYGIDWLRQVRSIAL